MAMYFNATIIATACEQSKTKGTPCVKLTLELQGDKDGFLPQDVEKTQYARLWIANEKGAARTFETLRKLGFEGTDILALHYSNPSPLAGKECSITADWEEYEECQTGEIKKAFKIQWVNPPHEGNHPLQDDNIFRQFNKFLSGGKSDKPAQNAPQPAKEVYDDDCPF